VLPLIEENDTHQEELFSMEDIKLETMRARGAGGQVNDNPAFHFMQL
jgi:peptide chain release factor 1